MAQRMFRYLVGSALLAAVWPLLGHATATAAPSPAACTASGLASGPKVTLVAPANGVVKTLGATIHFGWKAVPCAVWYDVEVWLQRGVAGQTLRGVDATITAQRVNMNTYILPSAGWAKGVYAWQVIAATANGSVFGAWSSPRTFTLR
ncbi:MAG TPA: hypothetical protein VNL35_01435 [Chloroflexota bacterium]|nr:hypothetical protein [Chloroflexota bacterium]